MTSHSIIYLLSGETRSRRKLATVTSGDLQGVLDYAVAEVALAVHAVHRRHLTRQELASVRETLAALIRLIVDMPDPKPKPPPLRERRPAQWFDPVRTISGFKMRKQLPPPPPQPKGVWREPK